FDLLEGIPEFLHIFFENYLRVMQSYKLIGSISPCLQRCSIRSGEISVGVYRTDHINRVVQDCPFFTGCLCKFCRHLMKKAIELSNLVLAFQHWKQRQLLAEPHCVIHEHGQPAGRISGEEQGKASSTRDCRARPCDNPDLHKLSSSFLFS